MPKNLAGAGGSRLNLENVAGRRVVICDDHPSTRYSLAEECDKLGCVVIGEVGKGMEAIDLVVSRKPDLLILDQILPDLDGPAVLSAIRSREVPTRVLVFTGFPNSGRFFEWINAADGPDGVLDKGSSMFELRQAIIHVLTSPIKYIPESIRGREMGDGHNTLNRLARRELDVVRLVSEGKKLPDVAERLNLAPSTVRAYMSNIYAKLGLQSNTLQAVSAAYNKWIAAGFVPPTWDSES